MDVRLPDGTVVKNVPEGTTQSELMARVEKMKGGFQQAVRSKMTPAFEMEAKNPASGYNEGQQLFAGMGKGMMDVGRGIGQWAGIGPSRQEMDEIKKRDKSLSSSGFGMAGNIAGGAAMAAPLMAVPGANTIAGGILAGGVLGAAQPVGTQDSRTANAGIGAAFGGGVPLAIKGATALGSKVADMGSTIGASFGNQAGTERLARHAAQRVAGDTRPEQMAALLRAKEYAPGAQPNVAEALAQAQVGQPTQMGGATIKLQKDLTGAKGIEDVLPSAMRQQRNALADHMRDVKATTKPMRETALAQANAGGVKVNNINSEIDAVMAKPGNKADDLIQKTLGAVKEKLAALADDAGNIDARELYTVRKKLGNTIATFSKETANWDKKQTAGLQREVQKLIDDAIESAGGKGWREYLKTYSAGKATGEAQKSASREAKLIAAQIKGSHSGDLAAGEIPKLPTLLSRPMMATNFALKMLSRDANTPVARMLAQKMSDPQAYARLLENPQQAKMIADLLRKSQIPITGGATAPLGD